MNTPHIDLRSTLKDKRITAATHAGTSQLALNDNTAAPVTNQAVEDPGVTTANKPEVRQTRSIFGRLGENLAVSIDAQDYLRACKARRNATEVSDTATSEGPPVHREINTQWVDQQDRNIDNLLQRQGELADDHMLRTRNPYAREIMAVSFPDKFKIPVLKQ